MASKNDISWITIVVTIFCVMASIGAGLNLQRLADRLSGAQAVGYWLVAGIFIALSAVILAQVLSALRKK